MCGSCWAFSTVGSMEAFLALKHEQKVQSLSAQELVDCSGDYGNQGCNGGLMTNAYDYIEDHGLTTEEKYPYEGSDMNCQQIPDTDKLHVSKYKSLQCESTKELSEALAKVPVSIALEVQYDFQAYTGGIYENDDCGSQLNHGVLLVGQKDNYYIVKNSWSESWGEEGYIRIAYKKGSGTCGMANSWNVIPTDE